ncbi:LOW QUALITY PROTEIN: Inositol-3-phosphate synthase [Phytophthora megakarya]|uniref:Inositol-3-phosphate synthase n=1 Tax=Phytophthora megakarya TaxID=4795 RepID=A0A225WLQ9_9STRA|nr:LOW QUALITY PROTEIN: Inositol-3-phosphate synthase [Phytophthora megakarya]
MVHESPITDHLGREKTYSSVSRHDWWPKLYKLVKTYLSTCETCQRVKPSLQYSAPLASLSVPSGFHEHGGLPEDSDGNTGVVAFVD